MNRQLRKPEKMRQVEMDLWPALRKVDPVVELIVLAPDIITVVLHGTRHLGLTPDEVRRLVAETVSAQ